MRIKFLAVPIAIGAIFFSSCKRNAVNLDFTNAKGEVPQLGNLLFRFNKSLIKDSLLNLWDSTEYISFEPKIPGRFRWESPDQLVFSPSRPFAPATTYKAKVRNEVLRFTKYDKVCSIKVKWLLLYLLQHLHVFILYVYIKQDMINMFFHKDIKNFIYLIYQFYLILSFS